MVDIIRPNFGTVWAASGEKLSPTEIKIQGGWIQEMMPYQYQNFLQNRVDNAITYILQKGVPEWDASQEYTANKSVVTYSGQLYMALTTNTNVLPIVTASWKKLSVTFGTNGAIPITLGGTGATNAADARTNLGIGSAATVNLPTTNGMVVKLADNSLVARSVVGTAGYITVTNGDGIAGNPTINIGANVAKTDADAAWTTTSSIRLPAGSTAQRGAGSPGRIRFNLETGVYEGYDNTGWNPIGSVGALDVQNFQGDGVRTTFTLSSTPRAENNTQVYFNGVYQQKNTYNLVGNDLVFDEAPTSDISIEVVNVSSVPIGTTTAAQTSIVDSGNYYNSSNVEGALQYVGETLSNAILAFPDYAAASVAAATLPDGQEVEAHDADGRLSRFAVQSGALAYLGMAGEARSTAFIPQLTGGVPTDAQTKMSERVSVMDFGAKCDGVTDDSAAVSLAISELSKSPIPKTLFIPGVCLLAAPVLIDRLVDDPKFQSYLTIEGGAFLINFTGVMFTSTLSDPENPKSSMVQFLNVTFEATVPELYSYVLDGTKFLRMQFLGCCFNKIRLLSSDRYVQSVYVQSSNARRYYGNFITCTEGCYDIRLQGSVFEQAGPCASLTSAANKAYVGGCNISNNLIEGIHTGPALTLDAIRGITIGGNYFEANAFEDIKMDTAKNLSGECVNMGVAVFGNFSQPTESTNAKPNFRAIRWGYCFAGRSSSNWSGGRLHAVSTLTKAVIGPDFEYLPSGDDWSGMYSTGDLPQYGSHYRTLTTTALQNPDVVGRGEMGSTAGGGMSLIGKGSASDISLLNNKGFSALRVPTGTRDVVCDGAFSVNSNHLMTNAQPMGNGAGVATGTLSNAPVAGNPTKWFAIVDGGTVRWVPSW